MAMVALVTLMGTAFALPAFQIANAQYGGATTSGGGGLSVGGGIEQQLKLQGRKFQTLRKRVHMALEHPCLGPQLIQRYSSLLSSL